MNTSFELVIVIPCFNEEYRIKTDCYSKFLKKYDKVFICFVNDGSTDNTIALLKRLKGDFPEQILIINSLKNKGKAFAIREGVLKCLHTFSFIKIAYLDADLSTSLEECVSVSKQVDIATNFAFGSRIAKLDTTINRKLYRFLIGRYIATLISYQLGLKVYDTQCGCKVFERTLANKLFHENFISRWLFDVEIFHRLIALYGKNQLKYMVKEVPLKSWSDTENSSVPFSYFFKLWIDLRNIRRTYKVVNQPKIIRNETVFE